MASPLLRCCSLALATGVPRWARGGVRGGHAGPDAGGANCRTASERVAERHTVESRCLTHVLHACATFGAPVPRGSSCQFSLARLASDRAPSPPASARTRSHQSRINRGDYMRRRWMACVAASAMLLATACATSGDLEKLEGRVQNLESRVDKLETGFRDVENRAAAAESAAQRAAADAQAAAQRADAMFKKSVSK